MKRDGFKFKRKKVLIFAFEGKNNKTESIYFSHFVPVDDNYVLKTFSCGVTDPVKMLASAKLKRRTYDYNAKEDKTFIFMDGDSNKDKIKLIKTLQESLPKDIKIILSNPSFEIWFLNHFVRTTKYFINAGEAIKELNKYIPNYQKNIDYFDVLKNEHRTALKNSELQQSSPIDGSFTEVIKLFDDIITKKA